MVVLGSVATSADEFMDDRTDARLIISSPADLAEVYRLRADQDAILVGATTIRRDDPSLVTTHAADLAARAARGLDPDPIKVTRTTSGNLTPDRRFFARGANDKIVFAAPAAAEALRQRLNGRAEVIASGGGPAEICTTLARRGVGRLMIEGGAATLFDFLTDGWIDDLRWAQSPRALGDLGHARFRGFDPVHASVERREVFGDTTVTWFKCAGAADVMKRAVDLARACPPTARAFSVGAVLTDARGRVLTTGYSRELGTEWHAEEVALARARDSRFDLDGAVMHSTMEPCGRRLSGKTCCADLIVAAGIRHVRYCIAEPPTFVAPTGLTRLRAAGVRLTHEPRHADEVTRQNQIIPG